MKRVLRWLRNAAIGVIGLALAAVAVIYAMSEMKLRRSYEARGTSVAIPVDSASIAEGERLARIRGCPGCHEPSLGGGMFVDEPMIARVAAPNLTTAVREYSNAELDGIARTVCTECHDATLSGFEEETPDLRIAAGYSPEQFVRLMRTGVALGERELELMSEVARSRFTHFTDEEIEALCSYLQSRAATPRG